MPYANIQGMGQVGVAPANYYQGGGQGGGMGGGLPWMQIAQVALQEINRDKADRAKLAQGLASSLDDGKWLMEHFPNFWGSTYQNPNVGAVENSLAQQNANIQTAFAPSLARKESDYEMESKKKYEMWKQEQDIKQLESSVPALQRIYASANGNQSSNLNPERIQQILAILGRKENAY